MRRRRAGSLLPPHRTHRRSDAEIVGDDALDLGATIADIEYRGRPFEPALQHAIAVIVVGSCTMERCRKKLAMHGQASGRRGEVHSDAIDPEGETRVGGEQYRRLAQPGRPQEDAAYNVGAAKVLRSRYVPSLLDLAGQ